MNEFRAEVKELQIGPQIRQLRQDRRMTLQDLSEQTELSKPLLSQIENEQVIPPLATLLRIAKALKTPLQTFFEEEDNTQKCLVVRAGSANRLNRRPQHGGPPNRTCTIRWPTVKNTKIWSHFWLNSIQT